jgi:ACS family hexuronate transporter-like MFS transporter
MRSRDLECKPVSAPQKAPLDLWRILVSKPFWAVAMVITGAQTVWHIYRVWLVKFLQTGRGYEQDAALNFTSVYYIATDIGCFIAGFISLWLVRRCGSSPNAARRKVYAGACLLTSLSLLIPWLGKGWPLLATLLLIGAGALALFPCYYSFVQELSSEHVGRLTGILSMWVWAVTAPLHSFFGMVVDRTKSYDIGLVLAGLAPWLGVIALGVLWKRDEKPLMDTHQH